MLISPPLPDLSRNSGGRERERKRERGGREGERRARERERIKAQF